MPTGIYGFTSFVLLIVFNNSKAHHVQRTKNLSQLAIAQTMKSSKLSAHNSLRIIKKQLNVLSDINP